MRDTRSQVNPRLAGALAYVIGPFALLLERDHAIVRFHSLQACLLGISLLVVNLSLSVLVATIYRQSWDAGVAAETALAWVYRCEVLLWLVMLYSGYDLAKVRIPWIGRIAERL